MSKTVSMPANEALKHAVKFQAQGRFGQAESICSTILKSQPRNFNALYLRGVMKLQQGQNAEAANDLQKAVKLNPKSVDARSNLGGALIHLGQLKSAKENLEKAIEINPRALSAHLNLSTVLAHLELLPEALEVAEKALAIDPGNSKVRICLAVALMATGQHRSARAEFNRALELEPRSFLAHNNLCELSLQESRFKQVLELCERADKMGLSNIAMLRRKAQALVYLGQGDEAKACFDHVDRADPEYIACLKSIANAHRTLGQTQCAIDLLNEALAIEPNKLDVLLALATTFANHGDDTAAQACHEQILGLDPKNIRSLYGLSRFKGTNLDGNFTDQLLSLSIQEDLSMTEQYQVGFSLARIYQNNDDIDNQMKYLRSANDRKKEADHYSIAKDELYFGEVRNVFERFNKLEPQELNLPKSERSPLFILGMPRSGTTLTEQILSAHSDVFGGGELRALEQNLRTCFTREPIETMPLKASDFEEVSRNYHDFIGHMGHGEAYVTDKMPLNFRFTGFIHMMFPDAKIVHLNRDPRAVCWSIYSRNFAGSGNGYANDLDDLARFYRLYLDMMDYWRDTFPGKIYDLEYEQLTIDQEVETRRLLEYCELDWQDACLDFHQNSRSVRTASSQQVRQKMYQGSSEAWRKYEAHLTPLLEGFEKYGVPLPN